ncbi:hypothetical protein NADFUDRAFT_45089 [Nadsonia fulvescens var. elongata DSM 6958]|uniref:Uncharacterized protein n=1 Tax=Nadsonia fulvescens var. elongata DSM 6958 TaxID=857566 RepID=A0A1E3PSZ9_9ASCO|nr:hypothetical protein NADFUDRAFT_45089 [Nadsonia fulvescens var. elongata DSM 6958]
MDNVRKDLFESDNENDDESNGELKERQSTHEKEKEALMNQISQLENELVSAKPWALRGEARARDRPSDSLIEVDVEFERGSKPVPVITQEVTESLEDLIRRRVKNYEFDDLPRRNPEDAMAAMLGQQRRNAARKFELLETKSQQSLAEIYEADHQKKQDPNAWAASQGPSPLDQTHAEVKALFRSLSHTLDTLSSWNYTAGPPEESVTIVANTPAIAMEDAQPTSLADDDTLAPQEVYKVGQALDGKREVVASTSGMVVSKSEMTREERKRQRRREKTRRAKAYDAKEQKQLTKAQNVGSRANVLETLKKGNVTVIGARGEKRDIDGKLKKDVSKTGSTFLKL